MKNNKYIKFALILICIGIIMAGVGKMFGGSFKKVSNKSSSDNDIVENVIDNVIDNVVEDTSSYNNSSNIEHRNEDLNEFNTLDIDIDCGSVTLEKGKKYSIDASYNKEKYSFSYSVSNNKLIVKSTNKKVNISRNNDELKVVITVPEIKLNNLKANIDTGSIMINSLELENTLITCNCGDIECNNINSTNLDLTCDCGQIIVDGELKGENKLIDNIGNIEVYTTLSKNDYSYDIKVNLGTGEVDGVDYKNVVNNANCKNSLKCDADIGKVSINFK